MMIMLCLNIVFLICGAAHGIIYRKSLHTFFQASATAQVSTRALTSMINVHALRHINWPWWFRYISFFSRGVTIKRTFMYINLARAIPLAPLNLRLGKFLHFSSLSPHNIQKTDNATAFFTARSLQLTLKSHRFSLVRFTGISAVQECSTGT